jgi:RNA polymerase sigma-70 factor (ECF subfamily)
MAIRDIGDLNLAQECAAGSTWAQEKVYIDHSGKVFAVCRRFAGSHETAEDLTQEVFMQIFRKISTFKGEAKLSTWIHRVAVNHSLMHVRRERIVGFTALEDVENVSAPQRGSTSGRENVSRFSINDRILIQGVIAQLPKGYRNVFVLHDVEGFEHEEVARFLNCTVGTSKSQLHKARLKLRKLINKKANPRLSAECLAA